MAMAITSSTFTHGGSIPGRQSCEGADLSPPLSWHGAPAGTRSFALVCEDPDAPGGAWHHWGVYNIPGDQTGLPEGIAPLAEVGALRQTVNDFGRPGYGGPCPPRGHAKHHYNFRLWALDVAHLDAAHLEMPLDADCEQLKAAAKPHVLAEAVLTGTYSRS